MKKYRVEARNLCEHIKADSVDVHEGLLIFKIGGDYVATFAPGMWAYFVLLEE